MPTKTPIQRGTGRRLRRALYAIKSIEDRFAKVRNHLRHANFAGNGKETDVITAIVNLRDAVITAVEDATAKESARTQDTLAKLRARLAKMEAAAAPSVTLTTFPGHTPPKRVRKSKPAVSA